jgi:hypothetical protein
MYGQAGLIRYQSSRSFGRLAGVCVTIGRITVLHDVTETRLNIPGSVCPHGLGPLTDTHFELFLQPLPFENMPHCTCDGPVANELRGYYSAIELCRPCDHRGRRSWCRLLPVDRVT